MEDFTLLENELIELRGIEEVLNNQIELAGCKDEVVYFGEELCLVMDEIEAIEFKLEG